MWNPDRRIRVWVGLPESLARDDPYSWRIPVAPPREASPFFRVLLAPLPLPLANLVLSNDLGALLHSPAGLGDFRHCREALSLVHWGLGCWSPCRLWAWYSHSSIIYLFCGGIRSRSGSRGSRRPRGKLATVLPAWWLTSMRVRCWVLRRQSPSLRAVRFTPAVGRVEAPIGAAAIVRAEARTYLMKAGLGWSADPRPKPWGTTQALPGLCG